MLDDFYDLDNVYHGDQSWRFYYPQEQLEYFESEFQPKSKKNGKNRFSIRSKIESLRRSFFNPDTHEEAIYRSPYALRRDSKGGFIEKIENWRRSWFGGETTPKPNRKLSLKNDEDVQKRRSLSESGFKRLSVTRNFVERHANAEEIYGKSPMTSRKSSLDNTPRREQIEVQAMVGSRRSSLKKGQRVTEDELCEEIVRRPSIDREILQKIKEIASLDYCSSGSEDDVSKSPVVAHTPLTEKVEPPQEAQSTEFEESTKKSENSEAQSTEFEESTKKSENSEAQSTEFEESTKKSEHSEAQSTEFEESTKKSENSEVLAENTRKSTGIAGARLSKKLSKQEAVDEVFYQTIMQDNDETRKANQSETFVGERSLGEDEVLDKYEAQEKAGVDGGELVCEDDVIIKERACDQLKEGIELFNDSSVESAEVEGKQGNKQPNGTANEQENDDSEEEREVDAYKQKSSGTVFVNRDGSNRASTGSKIVISSKSTKQ
eukprot:gene8729-14750_t